MEHGDDGHHTLANVVEDAILADTEPIRRVLLAAKPFDPASVQLGLSVSYCRAGHQSRATAHLTTAAELFRKMGMAFWLEKAAVEIK